MRKVILIGVLSLFTTLSGCAVNPYKDVKVDSVNKSALVAIAELRAANALLQELIRSGTIPKKQAQDVFDRIQSGLSTVRRGVVQTAQTGDPLHARNGVEKADQILSVVMAIMAPMVNREMENAA